MPCTSRAASRGRENFLRRQKVIRDHQNKFMKNILVMYHGNCPDGMGGAYSAWKKFGNTAEYKPLFRGDPLPDDLEGREIYLIDFSFPKETMFAMERKAKRLVVLDHHIGVKDDVEATREHVFDVNRSGAGIAWEYFHSNTPLPKFLAYIQEGDLWRFSLPNAREVGAYVGTITLDLETYDRLVAKFEDEKKFKTIVERGKAYSEYSEFLCDGLMDMAEEVEFEGYTVLAINSGRALHSLLGNILAKKHPPFSIVWYRFRGMWHFSLRGDGSVDLSAICKRYGGGGHHSAAGFVLPFSSPMPFTFIKKN